MTLALTDLLSDLARIAVSDVFQSYGVRLTRRPGPAPTPALVDAAAKGEAIVASVVGFNGADFRGTALLATTFELAASARPPAQRKTALSTTSAADWIFVRDWVGELCNQTLGRIKNRVSRYGVAFDVAPPAAFSGSALTFALPKSPVAHSFAFDAGDHTVWMCLDAIHDPLRRVTAASEDATAAEGKLVVFD
jgi:CheY-specific phosphatase CheX